MTRETEKDPGRTARQLVRSGGSGFVLEAPGEPPVRAIADGPGWRVECGGHEWRLVAPGAGADGFVLVDPVDGRELGRTLAWIPSSGTWDPRWVLVEDGRLYRIVVRGIRGPEVELRGWETSGAYVVARREPGGWTLTPEPASAGLPGIGDLMVLFAAELLAVGDDEVEDTDRA